MSAVEQQVAESSSSFPFGQVTATFVAYPTVCVFTAGITSALLAKKNPATAAKTIASNNQAAA